MRAHLGEPAVAAGGASKAVQIFRLGLLETLPGVEVQSPVLGVVLQLQSGGRMMAMIVMMIVMVMMKRRRRKTRMTKKE